MNTQLPGTCRLRWVLWNTTASIPFPALPLNNICVAPSRHSRHTRRVLGIFNDEEAAAREYDIASLRVRGRDAVTNFPLSEYQNEKLAK